MTSRLTALVHGHKTHSPVVYEPVCDRLYILKLAGLTSCPPRDSRFGVWSMKSTFTLPPIFTILLFIPLFSIGEDLISVSLPTLTTVFSATPQQIRSTSALLFIGLAIGELPLGTLSDHVGRKPILVGSICLLALSSLLPLYAHHIGILYITRFLQGLACAGPYTAIRAMIADLYTGARQIKHLAKIYACAKLGTLCLILLGAYLLDHYGWQANWIAISVIAAMMALIAHYTLQETLPSHQPLQFHTTWSTYQHLLRSPLFLRCCYFHIFGGVQLILIALVGPFLIQSSLGYPAITYSHCAGIVTGSALLGSVFYVTFLYRYPLQRVQSTFLGLMSLITLLFLWQSAFYAMTLTSLTVPVVLLAFCSSIFSTSSNAYVMQSFPSAAGTTGALFGFLSWGGYSIVTACAASLKAQHQLEYALFTFLTIALSILLCTFIQLAPQPAQPITDSNAHAP